MLGCCIFSTGFMKTRLWRPGELPMPGDPSLLDGAPISEQLVIGIWPEVICKFLLLY